MVWSHTGIIALLSTLIHSGMQNIEEEKNSITLSSHVILNQTFLYLPFDVPSNTTKKLFPSLYHLSTNGRARYLILVPWPSAWLQGWTYDDECNCVSGSRTDMSRNCPKEKSEVSQRQNCQTKVVIWCKHSWADQCVYMDDVSFPEINHTSPSNTSAVIFQLCYLT